MDHKRITIMSSVTCLVAMVLFVVAFGSPWWFDGENDGFSVHFGLFTACLKGYGLADKFKAALAMACLALGAYVAALVGYIVAFVKATKVTVGAACCGIAGLLTVVAAAAFSALFRDTGTWPNDSGWAFAVLCTSCAIALLNSIVSLVVASRNNYDTLQETGGPTVAP